MDLTSEEAEILTNDKAEWRRNDVWPNTKVSLMTCARAESPPQNG